MSRENGDYRTNSIKNFTISFKRKYERELTRHQPKKVALLFTPEYEGIYKNGGIGTYYRILSEALNNEGWYVILLLIFVKEKQIDKSSISTVNQIFTLSSIQETLNLQQTHKDTLSTVSNDVIDRESFCALFFSQAFAEIYENSMIYAEFPDYLGVGYRTVQGKESQTLKSNLIIGVTLHSCHEWLNEANQKFIPNSPSDFLHIAHYEQYSFENADLSFFPSYFLRNKVKSYGWDVEKAIHLPNFVPLISEILSNNQDSDDLKKVKKYQVFDKIPLIFFGRLEDRKGFLTFIKALSYLSEEIQQNIHVFFIGKIVQLQHYSFRHLNSREYLESQNVTIPYTLIDDFGSEQAISFVKNCVNPIVCLASDQENFPNTGLEMGQLPIKIIASHTGGFKETLELINRIDHIYWFEPKNSRSLAETIEKAIEKCTNDIQIPKNSSLKRINQKILDDKLQEISTKIQKEQEIRLNLNSKPKVTIGITCYNLGEYLIECLSSVEAQSYSNIEVLVLDDASTDEYTRDIFYQAKRLFTDFKFIDFQVNGGLGKARNYLIEEATGEFFLPLDADNLLTPFAVEKFVQAAIYSEATIVICKKKDFGESHGEVNFLGGPLPILLQENVCGDACSLFRTQFLKEFKHPDNRDISTQDWEVIASAYITGRKIVYYPYHLYEYRIRSESMIRSTFFAKEQYYLRQYLAQIPPKEWQTRQLYLLMMSIQLTGQKLNYSWGNQHDSQDIDNVDNIKNPYQELEEAKMMIKAMESSKFWKLRKIWFKIKRAFGYKDE